MDDFADDLFPEIEIETENMILSFSLKKDYSKINSLDERKKVFINDLNDVIDEFSQTDEFNEFMKYFD